VAEQFLAFAFQTAATEQGQPTDIVIKVEKKKDFAGPAKIELLGLPNEVTSEPREITQETAELVFPIKTTAKSPAGRHKTVIARAIVMANGEPISHTLGTGELRIDVPTPPKVDAPPPVAAPPPMPVAEAAPQPPAESVSRGWRSYASNRRRLYPRRRLPQQRPPPQRPPPQRPRLPLRPLPHSQHQNMPRFTFQNALLSACLLAAIANQSLAESPVAKLDLYPPDVQLTTARDRQSFIAVATRADGVTQDVTAAVKVTLADPALAKLDGHTLYPTADGSTTLAVVYQGLTAMVPVVVKDAAADRPISFKLDVMPVFLRTGCNTGSCHGAARGKDGFNLSLLATTPTAIITG